MRPFVLTCMLTALAGCGTLPCKDGTVLAELTLEGAAAAADQFIVHATLDGEQWSAVLAHRPGTIEGTLELDFAHGYPAGKILSVTIDAQVGATIVATGSAATVLAPECTRVAVFMGPSDLD